MSEEEMARQALEGIRVVDLSRILSGPFCSMMLADQGAEVIKVEIPERGDDARHVGPPFINGESAFFISINRNKKSMTLNLKDPKGMEILQRLIQKSDVLVENFRPGVMERLGIEYTALREINPRLVYCSISGYGQSGPYRNRPGYNFTVQAISGVMTVSGEPGVEPSPVGISLGDIPAGMFAAYAITLALFAREDTGIGQYIDISMLDSLLAMLENPIVRYGVNKKCPQPIGRYNPAITPFGVFNTKDLPIVIAAGNDKLWKALCERLGLDHLVDDPRFVTNGLRTENRDELHLILEEILATQTSQQWLGQFIEHGIPAAPVNTVAQVFADPQIQARNMLIEVEQPTAGRVTVVGTPVRLSSSPEPPFKPAPQLGKQTEAVLTELLGFSSADIEAFRTDGII